MIRSTVLAGVIAVLVPAAEASRPHAIAMDQSKTSGHCGYVISEARAYDRDHRIRAGSPSHSCTFSTSHHKRMPIGGFGASEKVCTDNDHGRYCCVWIDKGPPTCGYESDRKPITHRVG
jgi:hypothetical protein